MAKKTPTPEELEKIRAGIEEVRRGLQEVIAFLQSKLDARKT